MASKLDQELAALAGMRQRGQINDEEYERRRQTIIASHTNMHPGASTSKPFYKRPVGIIAIVLGVLVLIGIVSAAAGGGDKKKDEPAAAAAVATEKPSDAAKPENTAKPAATPKPADTPKPSPTPKANEGKIAVGSVTKSGGLTFTILAIDDPSPARLPAAAAGNRIVRYQFRIENTAKDEYHWTVLNLKLVDAEGFSASVAYGTDKMLGTETLPGGSKMDGYVSFEIGGGRKVARIEYKPFLYVEDPLIVLTAP